MNTDIKKNAGEEIKASNSGKLKSPGRTIFCHFSFKRPKGKDYGLFAVSFYSDFEGKNVLLHKTRKYDLWQNHQFVTAIQSYEHALLTIFELQGIMRENNINQVMLVTDNSTLAGWIEYPKKNKQYAGFMEKAVKPYRVGSYKEIVIGVGLCEPRKAEKSYKYCKEELVENNYIPIEERKEIVSGYKMGIGEYKSVLDIIAEDSGNDTDIVGIKAVD